eukprot:gene41688-56442_t
MKLARMPSGKVTMATNAERRWNRNSTHTSEHAQADDADEKDDQVEIAKRPQQRLRQPEYADNRHHRRQRRQDGARSRANSAMMEMPVGLSGVALFALLMERLDDEALCFLSRRLKRGSFALMTRATLGAPTFEVALRRVAHTFSLLQDDLTLVLLQDGPLAGFGLRLNDSAAVQQNFLHELMLRVYWRLLAWLHGGRLAARRFDFGFELPPYADGYAKVFPGPLQFGQPCTAVWFDAGALQTPVHRDAQAMNAFLAAAPANVILPRLAEQAVSARVRSVLQQNRPAWADLATAASSLHMSVSTLQRHLATEGTSFQSLKDQLRRDLAIVRLNTSTVPLAALEKKPLDAIAAWI